MSQMMGRHVGARRGGSTVMGCPIRGCDGVVYNLADGELLSRQKRAGWHPEERQGTCDKCGHEQSFRVMVRDA